jgi:hypothetical protein
VCFGEWVNELWHAAQALRDSGGRHVYDEGEQGQPAFVFEREGDRGFFSIIASEFSEGEAHPDWQRIEFCPNDFLTANADFRRKFFAELRAAAPKIADGWLARLVPDE